MAPPRSWVTNFAVFDSVITAAPVGGPALLNCVHWWDFNNAASRTDSGGAVSTITDLISSAVMTGIGAIPKVTTLGGNGLTAGSATPAGGGAPERMTTSGLLLTSQPIWVSWIGKVPSGIAGGVFFDLKNSDPRPHAYSFGAYTIKAGTELGTFTADGNAHVFYAEYNGASSKIYIDGTLADSGNAGTAAAGANASLFNVYPGGVGGGPIVIGEIAFGTGTNSGGDITAEYNRLDGKWI